MLKEDKKTGYGVDVALSRSDDLDKQAIAAVGESDEVAVLDLGCGAGGGSLRLAEAGGRVVAVDIYDFSNEFLKLRALNNLSEDDMQFIAADMMDLPSVLNDEKFTHCVCRRVLHYLPYKDALNVLKDLRERVTGKLFIDVTGLETDIGDQYPCSSDLLENRLCQLVESARDTFAIHEFLCLYSPEEFSALLIDAGWEIEEMWLSAFGNIKAVCN